MKKISFFALLGLIALTLFACENKQAANNEQQPAQQEETIPASFPRKHLIEEFTSQYCGYCPYGMDFVHEFMSKDSNYILVLHHAGFQADNFTIKESSKTSSALKVAGAPNVAIDRVKTTYMDEDVKKEVFETVFHPYYLPQLDASQYVDTTYASINIKNTYDPATRQLTVIVSGVVIPKEHPALNLSIFIKESGMIDIQADYIATKNGWKEFRHTDAVREYLTEFKGDQLTMLDDHHYELQYMTVLKEKWVADNCMVVAFLGEAFQPVIQVAEQPVVAGTKGGADIQHGGITKY